MLAPARSGGRGSANGVLPTVCPQQTLNPPARIPWSAAPAIVDGNAALIPPAVNAANFGDGRLIRMSGNGIEAAQADARRRRPSCARPDRDEIRGERGAS